MTQNTTNSEVQEESWHVAVGVTLAVCSGVFIGTSFVFKKKGILDSTAKYGEIGSGHAYLKSSMWWIGLLLMTLGEFANIVAYAFTPAILVTPLGALSVVVSATLSSIFLKEKLDFSGKIGCTLCVIGAIIIMFNAPAASSTETVPQFISFVLSPGFLSYSCLMIFIILYIIYSLSPRYGHKYPIIYISICSMVGSFLVISIQGFGSAMVYTASNWTHDNQFVYWPTYILFAFIIFAIITQLHFLNKALNLFSTAIVTPIYYVFFTTMTLITSAILFQGFPISNFSSGASLILGFLVILCGVALLFKYNIKITAQDPSKLRQEHQHMLDSMEMGVSDDSGIEIEIGSECDLESYSSDDEKIEFYNENFIDLEQPAAVKESAETLLTSPEEKNSRNVLPLDKEFSENLGTGMEPRVPKSFIKKPRAFIYSETSSDLYSQNSIVKLSGEDSKSTSGVGEYSG